MGRGCIIPILPNRTPGLLTGSEIAVVLFIHPVEVLLILAVDR